MIPRVDFLESEGTDYDISVCLVTSLQPGEGFFIPKKVWLRPGRIRVIEQTILRLEGDET